MPLITHTLKEKSQMGQILQALKLTIMLITQPSLILYFEQIQVLPIAPTYPAPAYMNLWQIYGKMKEMSQKLLISSLQYLPLTLSVFYSQSIDNNLYNSKVSIETDTHLTASFQEKLGKPAPERLNQWSIRILIKQRMMGWQCQQLDYMQIIRVSLQTDNSVSTSLLKAWKFIYCRAH